MGRALPYVVTMVALDVIGFAVGSALFPPDAYSQLFVFVPTLILAPLVAYWLVYRGGYEYLQLDRYLGDGD